MIFFFSSRDPFPQILLLIYPSSLGRDSYGVFKINYHIVFEHFERCYTWRRRFFYFRIFSLGLASRVVLTVPNSDRSCKKKKKTNPENLFLFRDFHGKRNVAALVFGAQKRVRAMMIVIIIIRDTIAGAYRRRRRRRRLKGRNRI